MTTIRLHNSRTHRKDALQPIDPDNVRLYVCGPTVYDRAHIGNARPVIVFDTLYRLLRHVYGPEHVTYVRNFTDVDDKINAAAQALRDAGDPRNLEDLIGAADRRDDPLVSCRHGRAWRAPPDARAPRDRLHRRHDRMIETLIAAGHAYVADGPCPVRRAQPIRITASFQAAPSTT